MLDKGPVSLGTEDAKKATVEELFQKLASSKNGLTTHEARERLQRYGSNEIPERKVNPIAKFLGYFWGPIPWMIEAAALMSAAIQHWPDFAVIFLLLVSNAIVGFTRERQAGNAIELLKRRLALKARVLRDNKWEEKAANELVPGDIIRVRLGDILPADVKLISGEYLLVDESALTGESLPVEKHPADIGYASSIVRQGEMDALVVNTGLKTYFGKTTKLVEEAKTQSHFQKAVIKIGDYLILLAITLVILIISVELLRNQNLPDIIQFALVLTVAAIPAALPTVLSVTMAIGAIALTAKEAIVSKLVAVEEMAGMDVLCSDKTGTMTKNELTVGEVQPFGDYTDETVLLFGAIASRPEDQDPIDNAVLESAMKLKAVSSALETYKVTNFKPFDPVSKRTEAEVQSYERNNFKVVKGAPQVVLSLLPDRKAIDSKIEEKINSYAVKGFRSLAVARSDNEREWMLVGLIGLYDPPREDSAETLKTAESMGVQVKMVTGDHVAIAKETARQLNMGTNIIIAGSLLDRPSEKAERVVEEADGFAEVFPEHKYRIVEYLQAKGHIVGMTGDGVNDAPALKKADVGIAVAGATDAAKSAGSIVLTRPGLSVIIDAIKESRKIFQRMNNYAIYRIAETMRVILFITASIIVFSNFIPVTALMIVLLAILNDLPVITVAYDNVRYSDKPEKWKMRMVLAVSSLLGLTGVVATFGALYVGLEIFKLQTGVLQSFIYLKLSVAGHMALLLARTKGHFWSIRPAPILLVSIGLTQLTATLLTVYGILLPAMGWSLALFIWLYAAFTELLIIDFIKVGFYRLLRRHSKEREKKR